MAGKTYVVDREKKIVFAKVESLTEKQIKAVKNYIALGYTLKEKEKVQTTDDKMKKEKVVAYLTKNGTEEQIAEFNKIMNEVVIDEETKQPKTTTKGNIKKKGYVAALQYFKKQFPEYTK